MDPVIVKNLGYRLLTLKGQLYGGWRGRQTASLRTKMSALVQLSSDVRFAVGVVSGLFWPESAAW